MVDKVKVENSQAWKTGERSESERRVTSSSAQARQALLPLTFRRLGRAGIAEILAASAALEIGST